jgi:hypothetical protein
LDAENISNAARRFQRYQKRSKEDVEDAGNLACIKEVVYVYDHFPNTLFLAGICIFFYQELYIIQHDIFINASL